MSIILELQASAGRALVVGGGPVALRRARMLVEGGFALTVVAPDLLPEFAELTGAALLRRSWAEADLDGVALVFACTDDREVNHAVGAAARAAGVLVGVADRQEES